MAMVQNTVDIMRARLRRLERCSVKTEFRLLTFGQPLAQGRPECDPWRNGVGRDKLMYALREVGLLCN